MRYATLVSTGAYLPEREVPNAELAARFAGTELDGVIAKLEERTHIKTRRYARDDQVTSDLAAAAAREALERAGLTADDVDLLLVGTDTPDFITPATSVVVQHKLGMRVDTGTFDVGCACASFPTGLAAAAGLIATVPGIRTVLVTGAYLMHRLADPNDPTVFFYGDAGGAVVLRAGDRPGYLGAAFRADGRYARHWGIFAGAVAEPASPEAIAAGRTQVRVLDGYPPEVNEVGWVELVRTLCRDHGFDVEDIALAIFTQVNKTTINKVCATLGLPAERAHTVMERWGYTGSACIPLALHDAVRAGKVGPGQLVVLVGSGVGYNQAAVALRVTEDLVA